MSCYLDFMAENRHAVSVEVVRWIDNKTIQCGWFWRSNIRCDGVRFYIAEDYSTVAIKRRDIRLRLAVLNGKMKLIRTENDNLYTRLIYAVNCE